MGTVLYECAWEYNRHAFIPLFMVIGGIIMLFRGRPKGFELVFVAIFITVSAAISALMVAEQVDQYNKIVVAYQQGDYLIVEGYVENFHPMPKEGHDTEEFDLNGVHFEYSDFTVQQGYHNALSRGGVITGDGQHLRIGYIVMESATGNQMLENVIVYIEELP